MSSVSQQKVNVLINTSTNLLEEAHKLGSVSLNSTESLSYYNRLIKGSLNCIFVILERYTSVLEPLLEAELCYKACDILLNETVSLNLASDYCLRGIQICTRSGNFYQLLLKLEIINVRIQYLQDNTTHRKSTLAYLNNLIDQSPCNALKEYLILMKFQYFGMTFNDEQRVSNLEDAGDSLEADLSSKTMALYQIIRIYQVEQMLSQLEPIDAVRSVFENLVYQQSSKTDIELPIQIKAMTLILDILISAQNNDFDECKIKIVAIDQFIKQCRKDGTEWGSTDSFQFKLGLTDPSGNEFDLPIRISWLTFEEFTCISYFYCGVSYLVKSYDGKKRTEMILNHCDKMLLTHGRVPTTSQNQESKDLRIKYLKLLIASYIRYSKLFDHSDRSSDILDSFVDNYDRSKFSSQELMVYHRLVPFIFYISATANHDENSFNSAQYYYLRLRKLYSLKSNDLSLDKFFSDPMLITFLQSTHGVGGSMLESQGGKSQFYLLGTINMLVIILGELESIKRNDVHQPAFMDRLSECLEMKKVFLKEIQLYLGGQDSDIIVKLTVKCLQYISNTNTTVDDLTSDLERVGDVAPLLVSECYYIAGKNFKYNELASEVDNLNLKVKLFNRSYHWSSLLTKERNPIAYLALREIHEIFCSYRNYFTQSQFEEIESKLQLNK